MKKLLCMLLAFAYANFSYAVGLVGGLKFENRTGSTVKNTGTVLSCQLPSTEDKSATQQKSRVLFCRYSGVHLYSMITPTKVLTTGSYSEGAILSFNPTSGNIEVDYTLAHLPSIGCIFSVYFTGNVITRVEAAPRLPNQSITTCSYEMNDTDIKFIISSKQL